MRNQQLSYLVVHQEYDMICLLQEGRTDLGIIKRSSKVFEDFSWKGASVGVVFAVRPPLHVMYDMPELSLAPA